MERRILLGATLLLLSCSMTPAQDPLDRHFERSRLPAEIATLYDEAVAYRAKANTAGQGRFQLDLAFLLKDSRVRRVVVVPFDDENWFEPVDAGLVEKVATFEVPLNRDFLIALDLGDVARNNYQLLAQLDIVKGSIPRGFQPRLCQQILCANNFRADRIVEVLPEMSQLSIDPESFFPPVPVGSLNRPATTCDKCFERPPGTGGVFPCLVWKCGDFPLPRGTVRVRKNIYTLTPAEITSLRNGVAAMKGRANTDPTSWIYQAKMHALDSGPALPLQDQCQHRRFFFASWHRMYIYYFERILRKASGDNALNLPYWNYTDVPAQAVLPEAFRLPANSSNSLYDGTRNPVYNGGAALPAADVSYTDAFNQTAFYVPLPGTSGAASFGGLESLAPAHFPSSSGSGAVERSPHNNVHNDVGGNMAQGESPRDPIFWLHHANIDRLWKRWIALGNGRENPTAHAGWMNQTFTFFDENGAQVSLTGSQILNTVTQLGYRYDDDPIPFWPAFKIIRPLRFKRPFSAEVLASIRQRVQLTEREQQIPLRIEPSQMQSLAASHRAKFAGQRLIIQLKNIQYDEPVGLTYLLFLNLPADTRDPDHTHPSFIGTLGFFGKTDHAHVSSEGQAYDYDVTRTLQKVGVGDLRLTIVPSYPRVPSDRPDLQRLVAEMRPGGNPRFEEITILRVRVQTKRPPIR
jgi:tyrosinase